MSPEKIPHSKEKTPPLFKHAAQILQEVKKGGSLKGLIYKKKPRHQAALFTLVSLALRHESELSTLIQKTGILEKEAKLNPWLLRILLIQLLWKKKDLPSKGIVPQIVQRYSSEFLSHYAEVESQVTKSESTTWGPRFVRVNTLKISLSEVLDFFTQEGWQQLYVDDLNAKENAQYEKFLEMISSLSDDEFVHDAHIPNLLVFPRSMKFIELDYWHDGSLIIQDKASCMSAHLLNPPPGSTVLDMCSAPGMKTTHTAALMNNVGTIYAIERDQSRFQDLSKIVAQVGASCVKPILGDAFNFSDKEIPDVEYILVDPSCSGSGMRVRKEIFNESEEVAKSRLNVLASFQSKLLEHAMTNFPLVKRIVYSTCSVHPEENESVVENALKNTPPNFVPIIPDGVEWMTKGSSKYKYGNCGFYANREVDLTNGFFLTVLERTDNAYVQREKTQIVSKQGKRPSFKHKEKGKGDVNLTEEVPTSKKEKRSKGKSHSEHERKGNEEHNITEGTPTEEKERKKNSHSEHEINENEDPNVIEETPTSKKEKKSKRKSHLDHELNGNEEPNMTEETPTSKKEKKKKKKSHSEHELNENEDLNVIEETPTSKKEKKSKRKSHSENEDLNVIEETPTSKKEKKSKRKSHPEHELNGNEEFNMTEETTTSKKEKKNKEKSPLVNEDLTNVFVETIEETPSSKMQKKTKKRSSENEESRNEDPKMIEETPTSKKKSKKKSHLEQEEIGNGDPNTTVLLEIVEETSSCKKEKKKKKKSHSEHDQSGNEDSNMFEEISSSKKEKKIKNKKRSCLEQEGSGEEEPVLKNKKSKTDESF